MNVDFYEWHRKVLEYYIEVEDYSFINDPTLTYQECVVIEKINLIARENASMAGYQEPVSFFDLDIFNDYSISGWNSCIARLFQPIEIVKPWTEILVDKRKNKPRIVTDNLNKSYNWKYIYPFDVITEDMERINQAFYKDDRIRVGAKVPSYIVDGEVYEIKSKNI